MRVESKKPDFLKIFLMISLMIIFILHSIILIKNIKEIEYFQLWLYLIIVFFEGYVFRKIASLPKDYYNLNLTPKEIKEIERRYIEVYGKVKIAKLEASWENKYCFLEDIVFKHIKKCDIRSFLDYDGYLIDFMKYNKEYYLLSSGRIIKFRKEESK